jgi:hypothetical protein
MKNKNKIKRSIRIEAISKIGFLLKVKAGPSFNPQAYSSMSRT